MIFHEEKAELQKATSKEGHLTAHGPPSHCWDSIDDMLRFLYAFISPLFSEKIYQGMKSSVMMFETVIGHSFKCVTEQSIQLSAHLQLKTMNVQLQAFDFEDDHFGNGKLRVRHVTNINFRDPWVVSRYGFFVCLLFLSEAVKGTRIT